MHALDRRGFPSADRLMKRGGSSRHASRRRDMGTWEVFHQPRGWLNMVAPKNIGAMSPTEDMSQATMSWSKLGASVSNECMFVTANILKRPRFWLKSLAWANRPVMSVTHTRKDDAFMNMPDIHLLGCCARPQRSAGACSTRIVGVSGLYRGYQGMISLKIQAST